jgi:hypothetical protein
MKRFLVVGMLAAVQVGAEEVTLKQSAIIRSERSLTSLKAGTVVELVSREGDQITIRYRNLTGKIPASKLEEPKDPPPATAKAPEPKPEKRPEKKPEEKPAENAPARPPQTMYGKAVQKAKDAVREHDKNLVKPTDETQKQN